MMRAWAAVTALSVALVSAPGAAQPKPSPASAATKTPTKQERAEAARLFNLGRIAFRAERYDEAILRWQESHALSEEPLILYNIGLAFEKLGDHAAAVEHLRAWRDHAPEKEREELDRKIEELDRLVAESAPPEEPDPPPPPPPEPPPPPPLEPKDDTFAIAGLSLMGVGGAAVVAGIIMDVVAANARPDEREACTTVGDRLLCRADRRDDIERSNTLAIAGDVTWIAGALIAGGGLAMYLFASDAMGDDVAVVPLVGPGGGGIDVTVAF